MAYKIRIPEIYNNNIVFKIHGKKTSPGWVKAKNISRGLSATGRRDTYMLRLLGSTMNTVIFVVIERKIVDLVCIVQEIKDIDCS